MGRIYLPSICMITEDSSCSGNEDLLDRISKSVRGGVNMVQLRDSKKSSGELYSLANDIRSTSFRKALFIVNDRIDVAIASEADGVQLKGSSMTVTDTRRICGEKMFIGRSVHRLDAAIRAQNQGADFLLGGTIFESDTHPGIDPNGLEFLSSLREKIHIPIIAVGGVTPKNAIDCIRAGAQGVAVIRAFTNNKDPECIARDFHDLLKQ